MAQEGETSEYLSTDNWKKDWQDTGGSGFHLGEINGLLKKYLSRMTADKTGLSFLFPFCGKDVDMKWLADMGHTVVGVECASQALEEFFTEQKVEYTTESKETFTLYKSKDGRLKMYCGNFYDYSSEFEGQFDLIWDRGGLNAVNKAEQSQYVNLMISLMKPECQYYLLNFDMEKIPENMAKIDEWGFVTDEKITEFFSDKCKLELRAEFLPAEKYNGSLCRGAGMEDLMEKLTIITLKK